MPFNFNSTRLFLFETKGTTSDQHGFSNLLRPNRKKLKRLSVLLLRPQPSTIHSHFFFQFLSYFLPLLSFILIVFLHFFFSSLFFLYHFLFPFLMLLLFHFTFLSLFFCSYLLWWYNFCFSFIYQCINFVFFPFIFSFLSFLCLLILAVFIFSSLPFFFSIAFSVSTSVFFLYLFINETLDWQSLWPILLEKKIVNGEDKAALQWVESQLELTSQTKKRSFSPTLINFPAFLLFSAQSIVQRRRKWKVKLVMSQGLVSDNNHSTHFSLSFLFIYL